jgi:adenine specific DNA methylase Mod
MFQISADRLANNGRPGKSVHVRRFSDRRDAKRYLDELVVRFKGSRGWDEHQTGCWIREAGIVTRYTIDAGEQKRPE